MFFSLLLYQILKMFCTYSVFFYCHQSSNHQLSIIITFIINKRTHTHTHTHRHGCGKKNVCMYSTLGKKKTTIEDMSKHKFHPESVTNRCCRKVISLCVCVCECGYAWMWGKERCMVNHRLSSLSLSHTNHHCASQCTLEI